MLTRRSRQVTHRRWLSSRHRLSESCFGVLLWFSQRPKTVGTFACFLIRLLNFFCFTHDKSRVEYFKSVLNAQHRPNRITSKILWKLTTCQALCFRPLCKCAFEPFQSICERLPFVRRRHFTCRYFQVIFWYLISICIAMPIKFMTNSIEIKLIAKRQLCRFYYNLYKLSGHLWIAINFDNDRPSTDYLTWCY